MDKQMIISIDVDHYEKEFGEDENGLSIIDDKPTERGFSNLQFEDRYGQKCSLQNSSLATEGAIWFGVDNTGPHLKGPDQMFNSSVGARMHLTRKQIQELLPYFKVFVMRGYIPNDFKPEQMWVQE